MTEPIEPRIPPGMGYVDKKYKFWDQDGKLAIDSNDKMIFCETCACRPYTGYFMCIIEVSNIPYRDKGKYLNDPDFFEFHLLGDTFYHCSPAFVESSYLIWPTMDLFYSHSGYGERKQPKVDMTKEVIYDAYREGYSDGMSSPAQRGEAHIKVWRISDFYEDYHEFLKVAFSKWKEGLPPYEPPTEDSLWKYPSLLWQSIIDGGEASYYYYTAWRPWLDEWMDKNHRKLYYSISTQKVDGGSHFAEDEIVKVVKYENKYKWIRDQNADLATDKDASPGNVFKTWEMDDPTANPDANIANNIEYFNHDYEKDTAKYFDEQWWYTLFTIDETYPPNNKPFEKFFKVKSKFRWNDVGSYGTISFDPEEEKKLVHSNLDWLSEARRQTMDWPYMKDWGQAIEGLNTMIRRGNEWAKNWTMLDYLKFLRSLGKYSEARWRYAFSVPSINKPWDKVKIQCRDGIAVCDVARPNYRSGWPITASLDGDQLANNYYEGDIAPTSEWFFGDFLQTRNDNGIVESMIISFNRLPQTPPEAIGIKARRVITWDLGSNVDPNYYPNEFPSDLYALKGKMIYDDKIGYLFGKTYELPLPTYEGNTKLILMSESIEPEQEHPDELYGNYYWDAFPSKIGWRDSGFLSRHFLTFCEIEYIMDGDTDWREEFLPDFHPIIKKGDVAPDPPKPPKEIM